MPVITLSSSASMMVVVIRDGATVSKKARTKNSVWILLSVIAATS